MMITLDRIVIILILIWASIYTVSYGRWTWRKENKLGAIALYITAAIVLVLPIYMVFFKGQ